MTEDRRTVSRSELAAALVSPETQRITTMGDIYARDLADAIFAALPDTDSLDAAWAEAEAALPEGWLLWGVRFRAPAPSRKTGQYEAWAGPVGLTDAAPWPRPSRGLSGYSASTPATALRALAARLKAAEALA